MDWTQVLTIVGSNIALILIMFGTTVTMYLHLDKKTFEVLRGMETEMKDFHQRLCEIEANRKK